MLPRVAWGCRAVSKGPSGAHQWAPLPVGCLVAALMCRSCLGFQVDGNRCRLHEHAVQRAEVFWDELVEGVAAARVHFVLSCIGSSARIYVLFRECAAVGCAISKVFGSNTISALLL